jgi:hypothetical protein
MTSEAQKRLTEREKLDRDIAGLKESIRLNWIDLDRLNLTREERQGIRENTNLLIGELKELLGRLDRLEGKNS